MIPFLLRKLKNFNESKKRKKKVKIVMKICYAVDIEFICALVYNLDIQKESWTLLTSPHVL